MSSTVSADEMGNVDVDVTHGERPGMYSYAWGDPTMASVIGIGITVGGGLSGFTDSAVRDNLDTDASGAWGVRATFGTHMPLGLELGYQGSTVDLRSSAVGTASLLGTTFEAALRYNILPHYWLNPYLFAGLGWTNFDLRNGELARADSGFSESDNVLVVPMGIGVGYRSDEGIMFDARGTFRAAGNSDLLIDARGSEADLHTWEASGNIGYEF